MRFGQPIEPREEPLEYGPEHRRHQRAYHAGAHPQRRDRVGHDGEPAQGGQANQGVGRRRWRGDKELVAGGVADQVGRYRQQARQPQPWPGSLSTPIRRHPVPGTDPAGRGGHQPRQGEDALPPQRPSSPARRDLVLHQPESVRGPGQSHSGVEAIDRRGPQHPPQQPNRHQTRRQGEDLGRTAI